MKQLLPLSALIITLCCNCCVGQLLCSEERQQYHSLQKDEGQEIQLKYIIGEGCTYHLTYNSEIFHARGLAKISEKYNLSKHRRSRVQREDLFGYTVISLTILNTKFEDRGEYSCLFTCGDYNYSQTFDIRVYKPPGLASCHWQNTSSVDLEESYSVLTCRAKNGHPRGSIACYTVDGDVTVAHTPFHIQGDKILEGRFWLNRNAEVKCCSVSTQFKKSVETCNDFHSVYHPIPLSEDFATAGFFLRIANKSGVPHQLNELHTPKSYKIKSTDNTPENLLLIITVIIIFTFVCIFVGTFIAFHLNLKSSQGNEGLKA